MRIAFFMPYYPGIGGTETVTHILAGYFSQNGIACDIIAWKEGQCGQKDKSIGEVYYLPDQSSMNSSENDDFILDLAKRAGIDAIINQGPFWHGDKRLDTVGCKTISVLHYAPCFKIDNNRNSIIRKFGQQTGSPVYFAKTLLRYTFKDYFAKRDFMKHERRQLAETVDNSDSFVVLCDEYIGELKRLLDIDTNKICAIPNPIVIGPVQVQEPCDDRKGLVYVGRLTKWDKNVSCLLEIWKELECSFPDWTLYIVGDGEERQNLERYASKHSLSNVVFAGFTDPTPFYRKSSVVCLVSRSEGFGMVILEGAMFRTAAIAFNVSSGTGSLIDDGRTGFLIEPFDKKEYVRRLSRMMSDADSTKSMGEEAYLKAKSYDIEAIGPKWLELFKELSSES